MKRVIYEVYAKIVDSNGSYNTLNGYPKVFDSRNYDNNTDKCFRRAQGEFSDTWGAMCKRDDRLLQTVILMTPEGFVLDKKTVGSIPEEPDPQSEPEPEIEE